MSDRAWWARKANRGIIGLGPEPWDPRDWDSWPKGGYDDALAESHWHAPEGSFAHVGHTREEWLALADEMIRRWTAYRARLLALPDDTPPPSKDPDA